MPPIFKGRGVRGGLVTLFALAALAVVPALASAAPIVVNTTADNAPGPGQCEGGTEDCSLRQAVDFANGEPGPDTIVLPEGEYDLTIEPTTGTPNDSGDLNVLGELTIEGAGARKSVIDASAIEDRVLELIAGSLRLVGLEVTGGRTSGNATEGGAGIYTEGGDLTLEGVALTDNEAAGKGYGGGMSVREGSSLTILDSVVSGNRNSGDGGGLYTEEAKLVRIEDSTFANNVVNTALNPADPGWAPFGGGMESYRSELFVLKNDTIAGNEIIDGNGGEEGYGAGLLVGENKSTEIANTIVAGNSATEVEKYGQCTETLESLGHNLESAEPEGEARCFEAPSDLIGDPLLGGLADNGGETDTMALGVGSPAIDAGDAALCLPADQRGQARVGTCDIGAYESTAPPPAKEETKTNPPPPAPTLGSFAFAGLKRNLKKGTAQLKVSFTGSGTATLTGTGLKKVTKTVNTGTSNLAVVLTGKSKKKLKETGKVKTKVTLAFITVVNTTRKSKSVVLKLAG